MEFKNCPIANSCIELGLIADVTFTTSNGERFTLSDVNPDSVSSKGATAGTIAVEFIGNPDRVVYVPNVLYWEFNYR